MKRADEPPIQSIAIVCPSWVGDIVMATPVYRAIREAYTPARIVGLVRPGMDALLSGVPWFDEVRVVQMKGAIGPWRTGRAMRGVDAIILLPNSLRSALGARLSGARQRIGYARDGRRWLLTHSVEVGRSAGPSSTVDYYAALVASWLEVDAIDTTLELPVSREQEDAAAKLIGDLTGPLIVLNPGANRQDKRWAAERFAAVADVLVDDGCTVAVTGAPAESETVGRVCAAARASLVNLVERGVTLGSLKGVLKQAALLITNDTGPRHIAAAVGTPVVALFGPTDHRWTTLPAHVQEHILLSEPFLPQELVADDCARACAIDRIEVGDVIAAARGMLRKGAA